MPPLRLTDEELDAVMAAARPIDPARRGAFMSEVAQALRNGGGELGPGSVFRAIAATQPRYLQEAVGRRQRMDAGVGKYG